MGPRSPVMTRLNRLTSIRSPRRYPLTLLASVSLALSLTLFTLISLAVVSHSNERQISARSDTPTTSLDGVSWNLGADVPARQFNVADADMGVARDGNTLWVVYSDGETHWRRLRGATMDNLVEAPAGPCGSSACRDGSFTRPFGDDLYWITSLWIDSSVTPHVWYATVHIEFRYPGGRPDGRYDHFRRIGLAVSTDQGATWSYRGDILTSDHSYSIGDYKGDYFDFGEGDQKLCVDTVGGYFYLYYMTAWVNKAGTDRYQTVRVARSPISAKMAPGSWKRWYQGAWSQPGLGGRDSDVFVNADSATVFYSSYLHAFVAIGQRQDYINAFIAVTTDLGKQSWSTLDQFASSKRLQSYNFAITPDGWDRNIVGQTFRLYSASGRAAGDTKYMQVTFERKSVRHTAINVTPIYPPEPVPDGNPGWDGANTPVAGQRS